MNVGNTLTMSSGTLTCNGYSDALYVGTLSHSGGTINSTSYRAAAMVIGSTNDSITSGGTMSLSGFSYGLYMSTTGNFSQTGGNFTASESQNSNSDYSGECLNNLV